MIKPIKSAKTLLPNAPMELPYDGAKPMIRITDEQIDDSEFLVSLVEAMVTELPKKKKKR